MISLGLALLGALAASAEITDNPLLPAETGSVQCFDPNEQARTCRSISAYRALGDGRYSNIGTVLISRVSSMTLETTTQVEVKKGAVCGLITAEEVRTGTLRMAGRELGTVEAKPYLETLEKSLKALIGKEVCTAYVASADGLVAKVSVNGVYRADTDQRVKWIGPSDLYTVSP
jgi:predicted regulator of Ras-like GTPase activity (Roadblock/LC7/MglB family)